MFATLTLITLYVVARISPPALLGGGFALTVLVGVSLGVAYDRWRREGYVRPAHDGLWEGTRCILPVARIRTLEMAASRQSSPPGTWLRLVPGGWLGALGAIEVEVGNDAGADEVASALGLDPNGRVTHYAAHLGRAGGARGVAIRWLRTIGFSAAAAFVGIGIWWLIASAPDLPWMSVLLATYCLAAAMQGALRLLSWPCQVTVGADGIALRRRLGRARFVSIASIDSVFLAGNELTLGLLDGTKVHLWATALGGVIPDGFSALERRLSAAVQGRRSSGTSVSSLLARGGRSVQSWVQDLSRLGAPTEQQYRQPALSPEALWRVVEDPSATGEIRVAASVALRAAIGEEAEARLSVIAATCADAPIRVGFETVVSGVAPAVLAALEELGNGEGPRIGSEHSPVVLEDAMRVAPSPAQSHLPAESDHERIVEDMGQPDDDAHGSRLRR